MYDLYFTLRSVTAGQRGRDALEREGLRCALQRAPREIAPSGCAYALAVHAPEERRAMEVLERRGVRTEGRFLRRADGFVRLA